MKVYGFPVSSYLCHDGKMIITGSLYREDGKRLVSVSETYAVDLALKTFEEKCVAMCEVRKYQLEYYQQAPQWLIRKIKEQEHKENRHE